MYDLASHIILCRMITIFKMEKVQFTTQHGQKNKSFLTVIYTKLVFMNEKNVVFHFGETQYSTRVHDMKKVPA